ncbi:MAG: MBL fold metallo-hydrolase [Parachlamydiaceae bacterium]|nr:MBL fold metallo-hydrolase [Parachlamydiaceae bacterium]
MTENFSADVTLFNDLDLPLLNFAEAMPVLVNGDITTVALGNVHSDQHIVEGKNFWHCHNLYHYNKASLEVSNSADAAQIFTSTQFERFLSLIGRIVETMFNTTFFSSYHYFTNGEDKKDGIYSKDAPLSTNEKGSSYFVGHATVTMHVPVKSISGGDDIKVNLITDPIEGDMLKILYPRMTDPARLMDDCPVPHVFLLSHNHRDHYDEDTLKKLVKYQPVMIVLAGDAEKFTNLGFKNVHETNWWQKTTIPVIQGNNQGLLEITAVPANHWSGQGPCDGHQATFVGFVIHKDGGDVYFAGDTARLTNEHIKAMREQFDIRTMFQPGGPDECRENMKGTHQSSVDGVWMHFELMLQNLYEKDDFINRPKSEFIKEAKKLRTIYMHNKTYKLGNLHFDDTDASVGRLKKALETNSEKDLAALREHELAVLEELKGYWLQSEEKQFFFTPNNVQNGFEFLTSEEILEILEATIVIPKIGARTEFAS